MVNNLNFGQKSKILVKIRKGEIIKFSSHILEFSSKVIHFRSFNIPLTACGWAAGGATGAAIGATGVGIGSTGGPIAASRTSFSVILPPLPVGVISAKSILCSFANLRTAGKALTFALLSPVADRDSLSTAEKIIHVNHLEVLTKNRNFGQKIEILTKNRNCRQKLKF